ncbi:MAG: DUF748 domain-containing protein [Candidatus Omnitrophica bacterium]|nr:DUF748 domain-containing protein [Candidatus Omnitrophota bacterium]
MAQAHHNTKNMRSKIEKILGTFILALAIIYATVYLYLAIMGQALLTSQLQELTGRRVTMGYFSITPSLKIDIKDIDITGVAKSNRVSASFSIIQLLKGRVILNDLSFIQPEFLANKTPPVVTQAPASTATIMPPTVNTFVPKEVKSIPFGIVRLNIRGGKVTFIDQTVKPGSIRISIQDVTASVKNFYFFPSHSITEFKLSGIIPWRKGEEEGKIEIDGWINSFKKDMRATFKVQNIDAVYLHPYYAVWVDLEKARIERAKLNFSSEIHGLNNDVTADCYLELSDMVRKPLEIGEMEAKASKITNAVLDRFKAQDEGSVKLNFTIKTKMDSPQFGFDNFKTAFEDKLMRGRHPSRFRLQDTITLPVKTVESGVRSFTDLSRAMIDGVVAIGNHIKESTGDMLRRKDDSDDSD